ncbi:MAG: D-alanyl-D-alanine carboxypeptidase/D-alanyl-D-alanine-endopeptidase [Betaproteobacteria bacterium]|nr:D-alanyl-D-alanine carboxypeptidase/D-alanyl-D-alanine-endopeptidase [Betaproteobacteria bacterium]
MQYPRNRLAVAAFAGLCFCLPAPAQLPDTVTRLLQGAHVPPEAMGAIVLDARTGETRIAHRAGESLQPASTLKTLTAIVALERLGPAWRGRSELVTAAPVSDGVLQGDLVLRGGADPDLDWPAFRRLLVSARNQGIREIAGDFVLDASFFQPARTDVGLPPFDETPEFRYNVIPDAIFLNGYLLGLEIDADSTRVRVSASTPLEGVSVESSLALVDRACALWEDTWKMPQVERSPDGRIRIRLMGDFPKNCNTSTNISVLDRVDFADRLFRALWRELGGTFRGTTKFTPAPGGRTLARHTSRSLAEITRDVSKRSDNPVARIVYLVLGTLDSGPAGGDTAVRAEREVRAWLKEKGIDDAGLVLENGSGLSRKERIRPAQLATVLLAARRSPWAPEFVSALPIVGYDGGMRKRLNSSSAAGKARIKTGTLRDVSAVAGYAENAAGEPLVVVAMINHPLATGSVARPILDAFLDAVVRDGAAGAKRR